MNKLFALLLLSASLAFAYSGGDGSYENPYQVASVEDWELLCSDVNLNGNNQSGVYFIQTADISFDEEYTWEMYRCGLPSAPFKGNYDGDGYYFSNLFITATLSSTATTNAFGLFGYCEEATVENVNVQGKVSVVADYNASACVGVGGVIGLSIRGLFVALKNYCDIDVKISNATSSTTTDSFSRYGVGGVIGLCMAKPSFTHTALENYGNIYADGLFSLTSVGGCVAVNVYDDSATTFKGLNNYGKVIAVGNNATSYSSISIVGGVGAVHANTTSTSRSPKFISCSNFGDVICSNSVHCSGVVSKGYSSGNCRLIVGGSTNHASVVKVNNTSARTYVGGVACAVSNYQSEAFTNCVNFGTIKAFGDGSGVCQIGGVFAGRGGTMSNTIPSGNQNLGTLEADCPNASSIVVGGVSSTEYKIKLWKSENYGNIKAETQGSVLIGGVSSVSDYGREVVLLSDCVNYGSIIASGNSNTNYSPCVGGVFASTRRTSSNTRNIVISNCYNLGVVKLNLNADDCYGAIYGVANTYGNYSVSVKNCYAILGEGQNLIGAVDASNGQVSLENCVGIKSGREGGIAYSVIGSNNWSQANTTLVSYDDCYHDTSLCYGNLFSGTFYPAEKSADFFDLILPMNTQLYPTPSAEGKKNHNYTKAQGYKRYIRTIQQ